MSPIENNSTREPQSTAALVLKGAALIGLAAGTHVAVESVPLAQQITPILKEILAAAVPILIAWLTRSPRR